MSLCRLCPRECGVDRAAGRLGFCRAPAGPRLFRWGPHFGEEPPLVGKGGSGCIFFSACTMKCLYCQNSPWSWRGGGEDVGVDRLSQVMRELAVKYGCANWNLVSPTPYLPYIREAAKPLADEGIRLPFVYNTSGYERLETLDEYSDLCDIALIDLRYSRNDTAIAASAAPRYVEASRAALRHLFSRLGVLSFGDSSSGDFSHKGQERQDFSHKEQERQEISHKGQERQEISHKGQERQERGGVGNGDSPCENRMENGDSPDITAKKGVIVRILVLPGHAEEAVENLAWISTELTNEIHVSVMSQYTPSYMAKEKSPWNRGVTEDEYSLVTEAAADFGFENGWIQGFESRNPGAALLGENMAPGEGAVG